MLHRRNSSRAYPCTILLVVKLFLSVLAYKEMPPRVTKDPSRPHDSKGACWASKHVFLNWSKSNSNRA
jgi:hypothetical protein